MRPTLQIIATTSILAATLSTGAAFARAPQPYIAFHPNKLKIGGATTLLGAHFRSNAFIALALAIPSGKRPRIEKLFGPVKTDSHGALHAAVHLPLVTHCGATLVYAFPLPKGTPLRTRITLTGCTAPRGLVIPPLPPGGKKHK